METIIFCTQFPFFNNHAKDNSHEDDCGGRD